MHTRNSPQQSKTPKCLQASLFLRAAHLIRANTDCHSPLYHRSKEEDSHSSKLCLQVEFIPNRITFLCSSSNQSSHLSPYTYALSVRQRQPLALLKRLHIGSQSLSAEGDQSSSQTQQGATINRAFCGASQRKVISWHEHHLIRLEESHLPCLPQHRLQEIQTLCASTQWKREKRGEMHKHGGNGVREGDTLCSWGRVTLSRDHWDLCIEAVLLLRAVLLP